MAVEPLAGLGEYIQRWIDRWTQRAMRSQRQRFTGFVGAQEEICLKAEYHARLP